MTRKRGCRQFNPSKVDEASIAGTLGFDQIVLKLPALEVFRRKAPFKSIGRASQQLTIQLLRP